MPEANVHRGVTSFTYTSVTVIATEGTGGIGFRDQYGVQTMCEGGGMANATIFELI